MVSEVWEREDGWSVNSGGERWEGQKSLEERGGMDSKVWEREEGWSVK